MTTKFKSTAAKQAKEMGFGNASYWAYLEQHALELSAGYLDEGNFDKALEMLTRSIGAALEGNNGD